MDGSSILPVAIWLMIFVHKSSIIPIARAVKECQKLRGDCWVRNNPARFKSSSICWGAVHPASRYCTSIGMMYSFQKFTVLCDGIGRHW